MAFLHQMNRRSSSSSSSSVAPPPVILVFLIVIFLEKSVGVVSDLEYSKNNQASNSTLESVYKYLRKINKPAVKTFEGSDGVIIDCVDKRKQLAFDHPRLKNHKLQVPSEIPFVNNISNTALQTWDGVTTKCSEGTVPIQRVTVEDVLRAGSLQDYGKKPRGTALAALNMSISPNDDISPYAHEYATISSKPGPLLHGLSATVNLWMPFVGNEGEMSIYQLWVTAGGFTDNSLNSIEAGFNVYPKFYGFADMKAHLFVYWTVDAYRTTGCYNLKCPGFVQVSKDIIVGMPITKVSTINGKQEEAQIHIFQDQSSGDWWLAYGAERVGYWPKALLPRLTNGAEMVTWGGEITNSKPNGVHTATRMGSGRFADDGIGQAAHFREMQVLDSNFVVGQPTDFSAIVSNANCYNLHLAYSLDFMGVHFFYGGPGWNDNCR